MSEGFLEINNGNKLWYQVRGSGLPVLFLHGGPGSDCSGYEEINHELFLRENDRFQLIEFDQRACGRSIPGLSDCFNHQWLESAGELRIDDLVDDCESLRIRLGIKKWMVFGGSWGSTLALRYSTKYPEQVNGIILRGIFLASRYEMEQFFSESGRQDNPHGLRQLRRLHHFLEPDTNRQCGESVLKDLSQKILKGSKTIALHYALDEKNTMTGEDRQVSDLTPEEEKELFVQAVMHSSLITNLAFGPDSIDLLENLACVTNIPIWMVHGIEDSICPISYADLLASKLEMQKGRLKKYFRVSNAGHSCSEPGIFEALKACLRDYHSNHLEN